MTLAFPAAAKIREMRLGIACDADSAQRAITRDNPIPPHMREIWRGEMLLANLTLADIATVQAFIEYLDGSVDPFSLGLSRYSQPSTLSGTIAATAVRGKDTVTVNFSSTGQTLRAGTLLTIGSISSGSFQLVEALEDVTSAASTVVRIAPRVRYAYSIGTAVAAGSVTAKFKLTDDLAEASREISYGMCSLRFAESL